MKLSAIKCLLWIVVLPGVISCNHHVKHEHETEQSVLESKNHNEEISLNNGHRWPANPETTQGINNMLLRINSFTGYNTKDYQILKSDLEAEFNMIIQKCTMKGEAHNQLHHFLLPMKEMFDGMGAEDEQMNKRSYDALKAHLKKYTEYFE